MRRIETRRAARRCFWWGTPSWDSLADSCSALRLGFHPFSLHVVGTLYGTHEMVALAEVIGWAVYNFAVYGVVPYLAFRRRYSAEALNLRSSDLSNDLLVIVVALAIQSLFQLVAFNSAILGLTGRELLFGAPLTFLLYLVGTALPIMIFVYGILVTRYLTLTGSAPTTVILGGVTYTLLHGFDGWTAFDAPDSAALSVAFLFLTYFSRDDQDVPDAAHGQCLGPRLGVPCHRAPHAAGYAVRRAGLRDPVRRAASMPVDCRLV